METIQRTDGEAQITSSWTDEDKDGGTQSFIPLSDVCRKEEMFLRLVQDVDAFASLSRVRS